MTFPPGFAEGIVAHMNEDHSDAVLAIARVYGQVPEAKKARMSAITPEQLDVEVVLADEVRHVTIRIDPPIVPLDSVRTRLVAMTRSARAALDESSSR